MGTTLGVFQSISSLFIHQGFFQAFYILGREIEVTKMW